MNRVRMKDLALVAFAGGLIAFELAALGEAFPHARRALVDRQLFGTAHAAPAALGKAGASASQAALGAMTGAARAAVGAWGPTPAERCRVVAIDAGGRLVHARVNLAATSCEARRALRHAAHARKRAHQVELALKQAAL